MLARWAVTVWIAWLGAIGLASALTAFHVRHMNPILPVGLSSLMFAAGLGLMIAATARLIRGPRRARALAVLLVGAAPFWLLAGHILLAMRPAFDRRVAPGWPTRVFSPLGRPLADLEARWFYPQRTKGKWVTMIGARAEDARTQVAAMDRHIEASLARLGQSTTWPITWYRGGLFGLSQCAVDDLAFGFEVGQYGRGADGLTDTDRHEVAHCVINRFCDGRGDPPRLLMEGWAEANEGRPAEDLADEAWNDRRRGLSLTLRQLVAPDWYWYSGPSAYVQGAPLVNYLLRVYGPERFLKLYTTCQQATFESDLRAVLGVGLDGLDAAYWADIERIVGTGPPARRWLKGLKLAPGIDPAAWDAFLAEYFAAAARLVAPYEHVRIKATYRVSQGRNGGDDPFEREEHLTLLRSGPYVRRRERSRGFERSTLIHPDHTLRAVRGLNSEVLTWRKLETVPWRLDDYLMVPPQEAYRRGLSLLETGHSEFEDAAHGGAVLLQYPRILKNSNVSTDYEVVTLQTAIKDGHRLVSLRLREIPDVRGRPRIDLTFVIDADDLFVVRSLFAKGFEGLYEYDYDGDRPLFRAFTGTRLDAAKPRRTTRLEISECEFGPIPGSEFALEPFLASLEPNRPAWQPVLESSAAAIAGGYWLAFIAGGLSLAGGMGLAVRTLDPSAPARGLRSRRVAHRS